MNYVKSWLKMKKTEAVQSLKSNLERAPDDTPVVAEPDYEPRNRGMHFSIAEYLHMIGKVYGWSGHTEEFWHIVTKIVWLIILVESNDEFWLTLKTADDAERVRLIRSWIGEG